MPRACFAAHEGAVSIDIQGRIVPGLPRQALRERLARVLREEGCPPALGLSVRLTGDAEISRLHSLWMGVKGATDVLSFPQDDPAAPDEPDPCLGDVVVSVDTAARQAQENGHPTGAEVLLLAVHGTLHLLGYDDLTEPAARAMRERERLYVSEAFVESPGQA